MTSNTDFENTEGNFSDLTLDITPFKEEYKEEPATSYIISTYDGISIIQELANRSFTY